MIARTWSVTSAVMGSNRDDHAPGEVVDASPVVPTPDGPVAVQDLLQDVCIERGLDLASGDPFEQCRRRRLVRMRGSGGVHDDVRVEEHHGRRSSGIGTDSRFIFRGDPAGSESRRSSSTARTRSSLDR